MGDENPGMTTPGKEGKMAQIALRSGSGRPRLEKKLVIKTTFGDLIQAVQEEFKDADDTLVALVVMYLD
jgi:hypothetical protein